jgi:Flp pilus assembly protein TadD
MRKIGPAILLLLAGCGGPPSHELATGPPSVGFARTALSDGAPQVALGVSSGILQAHPDDEAALLVQGDALSRLGHPTEAEASFRHVLARDPGAVAAYLGLGRLFLASNPTEAEAMFQQAIDHAPTDTAALNDLGIARDLQGHHLEAQLAYRQALDIAHDMPAATANLALSLSLSGHAGEALQLLKPLAAAPDATPRLRYDLAAVATMAGERQTAADALKGDLPSEKLQDALDGFAALSAVPP